MNYKKLFFFLFLSVSSPVWHVTLCRTVNALTPSASGQPAAGLAGAPLMDPQQKEIFDFVSGLDQEQQEQLLNEIFEEVSKLPEDQQKEFWQEVEQEAVKLEEQMKHFEPVTAPAEQPAPQTSEPTKPMPQETIPTEPIAEKKAPLDKEIKKAEQLLDSLIQELERFSRKVVIIPRIDAKINRWIINGNIKNIPANTMWSTISSDIEQLKQELYVLLSRDTKTNKHKHLTSFLEHENLYNNLAHLERFLITHGSRIETPDFGSSELTKETKVNIKQALTVLAESIYVLKTVQELEKVIGEYHPYAEKIKKEQEELQQIAQGKAARPRASSPLIRAGQPPVEPRAEQTKWRPFRSEYRAPHYEPLERKTASAGADKDQPGGAEGKKTGAPAVGKEEKPGQKKPDVKREEKEKKKPKEVKEDPLAKDYIASIMKNLETALDLISGSKLENIHTYLLTGAPVDIKLATETIPAVTTVFDKATIRARSLQARVSKRIKDTEQQKKYQDEIKDVLEAYKPSFEKISNAIKAVKRTQTSVSADKQYAYLEGAVQPNDANLLAQIPTPASLYRLQEKIDEFFKTLQGKK